MRGVPTHRALGRVGLLFLLAASPAGLANAQVENPQTRSYVSPLVIPAAAFLSDGFDPWDYHLEDGYLEGEGMEVHLVAPVYLPEGAKVRGLRAYIFDSASSCDVGDEDVEIFLRRVALADGSVDPVAITTSDGISPNVEYTNTWSLDSAVAVIDNNEFAYWLDAKICSNLHRLYSVVIEY